MNSPDLVVSSPDPAEGLERLIRSSYLYVRSENRPPLLQAQVRWGQSLNKHWLLCQDLLRQRFRSPNTKKPFLRADMILGALRIQGTYGSNFASAKVLASNVRGSASTWDRLLVDLRAMKLVRTRRLMRANGTEATNEIDLTPLWEWLWAILAKITRNVTVEQVGKELLVKIGGIWEKIGDICSEATPFQRGSPTGTRDARWLPDV